tara:strand:- start:4315 stop:4926 length:612 start_codon:yes stop_codon:yes gene_type:complete
MRIPRETEAQAAAFEWSVDYKPFEEDLRPQEYARYGYEKGYEHLEKKLRALEQAYRDTIWMARRYAAGRHTHAPSTVERHIQNVEKVCGIKVDPDHTIVEDAGITLLDQHSDYETRRKVGVTEDNNLVSVEFEHYNNCGTCDSAEFGEGQRTIVGFEVWEGELRCLIWADINREDPTHVINLDGAQVTERKEDESYEKYTPVN